MILGCHVVGERAVEIVQVVAIAIAAEMRVDNMAKVPLSFPTYAGILGRAAYRAAQQIYPEFRGHVH
jgi:pyruvate/2-oxoglutarate dehydrogenase complex dihydrolipoamide dehydrogenase (E3) component